MKVFILISFLLTGCASMDDMRSFFYPKIECGNGWRSISERICEFENYGY